MKIFLCGQKHFGWLIFNIIQELGHDVIGVSAPVDDRLYRAAFHADVPHLIRGGTLNQASMPEGADLIVAAHSYDFISDRTLGKTQLGGIGYHPSLLPLHRGRDAVRWTIKMGDKVTGGTVYWLTKNVDAGPVAAQDWCFVPPGWNASRLWREKLQPMGARLIAQTLTDLEAGRVVAIPQDEAIATWEPSMDCQPIFRPDLPQLGTLNGFDVITTKSQLDPVSIPGQWRTLAGG
jgi:methionyl-tRNA formyltransferase